MVTKKTARRPSGFWLLSDGRRGQEDGPEDKGIHAGQNDDAGETFKKLFHNNVLSFR